MYKTDGFSYKTLNIRTTAGVRDYSISNTFANGLPRNAVLVGVLCRVYSGRPGEEDIAYNGTLMVNAVVQRNSFVSLQKADGHTLVENKSYSQLSDEAQWFEPTKVKDFDFSASRIYINTDAPSANIVDNESFELVFFYIDECNAEKVPSRLELRDFAKIEGERYKLLEITVRAGIPSYQLSTSLSVGLPDEAVLVGVGLNESSSPTARTPVTSIAKRALFLNLKAESRTYVDNFPFDVAVNVTPTSFWQKNYLAVTPRRVKDVDWDNSNIFFAGAGVDRISDDQVVLLSFHYVMP